MVEVYCVYWGMSFYVIVLGVDSLVIVGLCGNNNGNLYDDLEKKGIYMFVRKYM